VHGHALQAAHVIEQLEIAGMPFVAAVDEASLREQPAARKVLSFLQLALDVTNTAPLPLQRVQMAFHHQGIGMQPSAWVYTPFAMMCRVISLAPIELAVARLVRPFTRLL
jgi:hypothetical protein